MLQDLPFELQEVVYNRLPVRDRIKFRMALPRNTKIKFRDGVKEKKLGVLSKAICKGKVKDISRDMKAFLQTCDASDPTIKEMALVLPEVKDICTPKQVFDSDDIIRKIKDGKLELSDCSHICRYLMTTSTDYNTIYETNVIKKAIFQCKPVVFDILMQSELFKEWLLNSDTSLYFN